MRRPQTSAVLRQSKCSGPSQCFVVGVVADLRWAGHYTNGVTRPATWFCGDQHVTLPGPRKLTEA